MKPQIKIEPNKIITAKELQALIKRNEENKRSKFIQQSIRKERL